MQTFIMAALIMLKADGLIGGELMFDDFKTYNDCISMRGIVLELMRSEVVIGTREPFQFVRLICLPAVTEKTNKNKIEGFTY